LNHDQGIGAFSNLDEGVEYSLRFNQVLSGLRKKGASLTDEEMDALRQILTAAAISPAFGRRLVAEHEAESLTETFLMQNAPSELALEFLLRRHKGQ
jgi:hypothetical protein